ncbi:hypothetical protein D3C77_757700 [compost metagenome]
MTALNGSLRTVVIITSLISFAFCNATVILLWIASYTPTATASKYAGANLPTGSLDVLYRENAPLLKHLSINENSSSKITSLFL